MAKIYTFGAPMKTFDNSANKYSFSASGNLELDENELSRIIYVSLQNRRAESFGIYTEMKPVDVTINGVTVVDHSKPFSVDIMTTYEMLETKDMLGNLIVQKLIEIRDTKSADIFLIRSAIVQNPSMRSVKIRLDLRLLGDVE